MNPSRLNAVLPVTFTRYDAIITAVHTDGTGDPEQTRYTGHVINTPDTRKFTNTLPRRRISVGARVVPAEPGDPCFWYEINGVSFLMVFEGILFEECENLESRPAGGGAVPRESLTGRARTMLDQFLERLLR